MKVSPTTPTVDFAVIRNVPAHYCIEFEAATLARKQKAYATLLERYNRVCEMEEEGITVTVTMTSRSGSITVLNDDLFEPTEYVNQLSNQLDQLGKQIVDLLEKRQTTGLDSAKEEAADDKVRHQALALLLPPNHPDVAQHQNQGEAISKAKAA